MEFIEIKELRIPIERRQSPRARRMSLRIHEEGPRLLLTLPRRVGVFHAERFLHEQASWIERNWRKAMESEAKRPRPSYAEGDGMTYLGEPVILSIQLSSLKRVRAKVRADRLVVSGHRHSPPSSEMVKKAIQDFYRKKAEEVIRDRLEHFNEHYGFSYGRVTFRNQKTRWGSCSSAGNLNFNWRLIMAPIEVIDYVVVHELCHLREMNHSERFWSLVSEQAPHHKAAKKWLKENNALLRMD